MYPMKKWLLAAVLCLTVPFLAQADSNEKTQLQQRIKKLNTFEADFAQKVVDVDGKTIMQGKGKVYLSHPSLIRWHALEPDENLLVSDGQTLWMYNIDLEQVTATDAKQAIDSTPFALLASDDEALWQNYAVSKQDKAYVITPKAQSGQVARLLVYFDGNRFSRLVIEDISKQRSEFAFDKVKTNDSLAKTLFKFTVPEGVELDDQRQ